MPRNVKCRRVCAEFKHKVFTPEEKERGFIILNVEELEAIRLCDLESFDQEEASKQMGISRGTFQRILYSARKKSAMALCEGRGIVVEGGNYQIGDVSCDCTDRCKRCMREINQTSESDK